MTIRFLTAKCYAIIFGVSIKKAERLIAEDRKKAGFFRITQRHLMQWYCLLEEDFEAISTE